MSEFIDKIRAIGARVRENLEHIKTEEATKMTSVIPFISALGYDVYSPSEVVPEAVADVGMKKGEKVDYAIRVNGKPCIIVECKAVGGELTVANASQLYRYFGVTDDACVAILTNGIIYRFFSDIDKPNKMDQRPFLELDMLNIDEAAVAAIRKYSKDKFDPTSAKSAAQELKYANGIRAALENEWKQPSEDLVRHLAKQVYDGRMTSAVLEMFTQVTKRAMEQFLRARITERLDTAFGPDVRQDSAPVEEPAEASLAAEATLSPSEDPDIETTDEELEAYQIVRAILCKVVEPSRVALRDVRSYCGVLLDDNNRKPLCRFHFNATSVKYLGLFDSEKKEIRHEIQSPVDIYAFGDQLRATVKYYE